jgi:tetratricopeptide (TPR) repeat protein
MERTPVPTSDAEYLKEDGLRLFQQGARAEALERFEMAAAAYSQQGDAAGQAEMRNNIGVLYRSQRNWPAALNSLRQAEEGFASLGADGRRAQVLGNLGDVYASKGDRVQAAREYSRAAELLAAVGDYERQSLVLRAMSLMRLRQRRWMEAIDLMAQSLRVRRRRNFLQWLFYIMLRFAIRLLTGGSAGTS